VRDALGKSNRSNNPILITSKVAGALTRELCLEKVWAVKMK
jgi:hypothetical protein